MTELAPDRKVVSPDSVILIWRIQDISDVLMVCRYHGSGTFYWARPQPVPKVCFSRDENGLTLAWCD